MNALQQQIKEAYELHAQDRVNEAENLYLKILKESPSDAHALALYGTLLLQLNRIDEAILHLVKSVQLNSNIFIVHHNLGVCYSKHEVFKLALVYFNNSLQLNKAYHHTYREKGWALAGLAQYNEAIECYHQALAIEPGDDATYINLSILFISQLDFEKALIYNLRAVEFNPHSSYYFKIQGDIYLRIEELHKSIQSFKKSIFLDQENFQAYLGLLETYIILDDNVEAEKIRQEVLRRNLTKDNIDGLLLEEEMRECDWNVIYQKSNELINKVDTKRKALRPFFCAALIDSPLLVKNLANNFMSQNFVPLHRKEDSVTKSSYKKHHQKIRIGYFSNDFYAHATTILMSELFRNHNHNDFYVTAFSYSSSAKFDADTKDLINSFDKFININDKNDYEASLIAREHDLDIAIDLKGLVTNARPGIFAHRVAPIQINFLGYPGTMGASWIDYIIADRNIIPEKNNDFYDEKIIFMPHCYQPNKQ